MSIANSIRTIYLSQNLPIEGTDIDKSEKSNKEKSPIDATSETLSDNTEEQLTYVKKRAYHSIIGYIYGLLYTIFDCISYIFIKKSKTFNGFNHGAIRYIIQIVMMSSIVCKRNISIIQKKPIGNVLLIRGCAGSFDLVLGFLSLQFLDVSDTQTLINSSVLITALMGRIFLKEKINICHIVSIVFTFLGVLFILRPSFLFGIDVNLKEAIHMNITEHKLNHTIESNSDIKLSPELSKSTGKIIGVALILGSAFFLSITQVSTRSLANSKIDQALISLYPTFFGFPLTIIGSFIILLIAGDLSSISNLTLVDGGYSFCAGLTGVIGLILQNWALEYEDAAKIGMLRISGVLFSMIFQYVILDVEIDLLGILGAVFIVLGTLMIILIKIFSQDLLDSKKFYRLLAVEF